MAEAIDAGVVLFRRHGFEATSLEALTEAMGISRSSFYAAFGSKRGVLLAALERYSEQRLGILAEVARGGVADILRALSGSGGDPHGCLLVNCIAELCPGDPEIETLASRHMRRIEALVRETLPPDEAACAQVLVAVALGAQTLRKSGTDQAAVDSLLDTAAARFGPGG